MANTFSVIGAAPFQVEGHSFAISASGQGYVLNYSADGTNYTAWAEATPANEEAFVINVPRGAFFKLVGNTDIVNVTY